MKMKIDKKVIDRIPRADDLELELAVITMTDRESGDTWELVSLREYVPSTNVMGRGVVFPVTHIDRVIKILEKIRDEA